MPSKNRISFMDGPLLKWGYLDSAKTYLKNMASLFGQKLCQQSRFRSFQIGIVGLCSSENCKATSSQIWRSEKILLLSSVHHASPVDSPNVGIILKV